MLAERARHFCTPPLAVCSVHALNPALGLVCAEALKTHGANAPAANAPPPGTKTPRRAAGAGGAPTSLHDIPLTASLLRFAMEKHCGVRFGAASRAPGGAAAGFGSALLAAAHEHDAAPAATAPTATATTAGPLSAVEALSETLAFLRYAGASGKAASAEQLARWQSALDGALKH